MSHSEVCREIRPEVFIRPSPDESTVLPNLLNNQGSIYHKTIVMSDEHRPDENHLVITEPIVNGASSSSILVHIQLRDHQGVLTTDKYTACSPKDTIVDVIRELVPADNLKHVSIANISLVKIGSENEQRDASANDRFLTLNQLKIKPNDTLYFVSTASSSTPEHFSLELIGPDQCKKVAAKWNKRTTTLKMLLTYAIETFSLQAIERHRIHLITPDHIQLDVTLNSNKLLTQLGIVDDMCISVQIVEQSSATPNVHIQCAYRTGDLSFDVSFTTTVEELKVQIEQRLNDHLLLDFVLFDRMHEQIAMNTSARKLCDLGVKSGEVVYARLRLVFLGTQSSLTPTGNTPPSRSTSLVTQSSSEEVLVLYQVSLSLTTRFKVSIHDTLDLVIKSLRALNKTDPSARFRLSSRSISFNSDAPSMSLSSYGIQPGDTIHVTLERELPVRQLRNDSTRLSTKIKLNDSPIGLTNLINTCYMNSALQCLAHVTPLTQFFLQGLTQDTVDDLTSAETDWNQFYTVGPVTGAYADVLRNLWLSSRKSYSYLPSFRPEHIKETISMRAPRFATHDQQDAQEFMIFLIDEIQKEMKEKHGPNSPTIIEESFYGALQSTITCSACGHTETTTNPINFLPLPLVQAGRRFTIMFIEKNGGRDEAIVTVPEDGRVRSLLQAFFDLRTVYSLLYNILVMVNDERVELEKPLSELTVDEVLFIEEDRFSDSTQYNRYERKTKRLTLDDCLREFCSIEKLEDSWLCQQDTCKKYTTATKQLRFSSLPPILIIQLKRFSHKDGLRDKIDTFVEYPLEGLDLSRLLCTPQGAIYDLFAVTKHIGSIYGGHYIAYAQHEVDGSRAWYEFDDAWVRSVLFTDDVISRDAYLLFYIRRNPLK